MTPYRLIVCLGTLALLGPYAQVLLVTWSRGDRTAAAGIVALVGALGIGWMRWREGVGRLECGPSRLGVAVLCVSTLAYAAAVWIDMWAGIGVFAVLVVAGLIHAHRGGAVLRALAVPVVLGILATPWPAALTDRVMRLLLDLTVGALAVLLQPFVDSVEVSGYRIRLPDGEMRIVDECSGLGGVLLFVPLSLILLQVYRPVPLGVRLAVVVLAVPVAVGCNLLRVFGNALLFNAGSDIVADPVYHELTGILALGAGIVALLLLLRAGHRRASRRVRARAA